MAAASHVLCHLAGTPFQSEPIFNLPIAKCQAQYDRLLNREELRIGSAEEMFVDLQEVISTVHCIYSGFSGSSKNQFTRLRIQLMSFISTVEEDRETPGS